MVWRSSLHCCVPKCTCSSRYNSCLSFHCFPADNAARQLWLARIRRANFTPSRDTRVCSRHFLPRDIFITPRGKRLLKKGTVPVLFEWNNYSLPEPRLGVWERRPRQEESAAAADPTEDSSGSEMEVVAPDHDYCVSAATGVMANELLRENESLRRQLELARSQIERLQLRTRFCLERFAGSDDQIRLYTRSGYLFNLLLPV
uniref:THAP domain-containing protein 1 n=1 Tax=Neogobius melanostomus TaxID=47308 RepID=A0A8C6SF19_9GOBI